jgi:hypothetical protein
LQSYLIKKGHRFRTQTDTEVILHLYEEFREESVQHLNGIFAFAIWDRNPEQVFIGRDRMGIKPLDYTVVDDTLIFGSEMKVILQHPTVRPDIDMIALNEYLSYEYAPSPRTIIRDVYRLEPGHHVAFDAHGYASSNIGTSAWRAAKVNCLLIGRLSRSPLHTVARKYLAGIGQRCAGWGAARGGSLSPPTCGVGDFAAAHPLVPGVNRRHLLRTALRQYGMISYVFAALLVFAAGIRWLDQFLRENERRVTSTAGSVS